MTIKIEFDTDQNALFIIVSHTGNDIALMEKQLADFIGQYINPMLQVYFYLSDDVWNINSPSMSYQGLWKQQSAQSKFAQYSDHKETKFLTADAKKVIFSTYFQIKTLDFSAAIAEHATQNSGHSFLFLSDKKPDITVQDIFNALNITEENYSSNDWGQLVKLMHKHKCIPIQKWVGDYEISLRLFLFDELVDQVLNLDHDELQGVKSPDLMSQNNESNLV